MKDEAALGIVHETEMLVRLLDRDNVHESDRVVDIGANLQQEASITRAAAVSGGHDVGSILRK